MIIAYPTSKDYAFSPYALEVRIEGQRKAALKKDSEVKIQFPENKTITVKLGGICKYEFKGSVDDVYEVQGNWYFKNSRILNTIFFISYGILFHVIASLFDSTSVWKYLLVIVVCLAVFMGSLNFFGRLCRFQLKKVN